MSANPLVNTYNYKTSYVVRIMKTENHCFKMTKMDLHKCGMRSNTETV